MALKYGLLRWFIKVREKYISAYLYRYYAMNRIQLRFGQAVGLKELVATLVVSGVLLIVGTVVFAKVKAATGSNNSPDLCYQQTNNTACFDSYVESTHENLTISGDAGTAVANVESTTYDAFELATVALIVLAAAVIIGILIRAFGA